MAVLRKITRSAPLTTFSQVVDPGNGPFHVLAAAADAAYEIFDPIARQQAEREGFRQGAGAIGEYRPATIGQIPAQGPRQGVTEDPRNSMLGTSSGDRYRTGQGITLDFSMGESLRPSRDLTGIIAASVEDILGPGARVQFSSGLRANDIGSQHSTGHAGDFAVFRSDGSRLAWNSEETRSIFAAAASRGARGFGAGPTYMGGSHFHVDLGTGGEHAAARPGVQVWSDDDGGASDGGPGAAQWLAELQTAFNGGSFPSGSASPAPGRPGVQIRTEHGELELRDADIFTSEYDLIRQQAATGAYSSRLILDAQSDLMRLRHNHLLDPDGFAETADAYIRQLTSNAPALIRAELGAQLQVEARREYNGIVAAQHSDIMNRAANESGAIVDAYSTQYADLLAQGDEEGAAHVRGQLGAALRYRETLPGLSWTPAQSANVIMRAERTAQQSVATQGREAERQITADIRDMINIAERGGISADEHLLNTPEYMSNPLHSQGVAAVELRDFAPELWSMPSADLDRFIAEAEATPVSEPHELNRLEAARNIREYRSQGLRDDPVLYAQTHLTSDIGEVPNLPETYDGTNHEDWRGPLRQRQVVSGQMVERGDIRQNVIFTQAERQRFGPLMGPEADPELRLGFTATLLTSLGQGAVGAARELGASAEMVDAISNAVRHGNMNNLALELRGEALIAAGQSRPVPRDQQRLDARGGFDAIAHLPVGMQSRLEQRTLSIAAGIAGNAEPTSDQLDDALQIALGQSINGAGETSGGIQSVFGSDVLLPPTISARQFEEAIQASTVPERLTVELHGGFYNIPMTSDGLPDLTDEQADILADPEQMEAFGFERFSSRGEALQNLDGDPDSWGDAGPPMYGDETLSLHSLRGAVFEPLQMNGQVYHGEYVIRFDQGSSPSYANDRNGDPYVLNIQSLMEMRNVR